MSQLGSHNGEGNRYYMYLSAPQGGVAQMLRSPDGQWVPYADCARLKDEVERLDALCKQLMKQHSDISCENIRLRASSFVTAVPVEDYERLKQENEVLQNRCDFLEGRNKE